MMYGFLDNFPDLMWKFLMEPHYKDLESKIILATNFQPKIVRLTSLLFFLLLQICILRFLPNILSTTVLIIDIYLSLQEYCGWLVIIYFGIDCIKLYYFDYYRSPNVFQKLKLPSESWNSNIFDTSTMLYCYIAWTVISTLCILYLCCQLQILKAVAKQQRNTEVVTLNRLQ